MNKINIQPDANNIFGLLSSQYRGQLVFPGSTEDSIVSLAHTAGKWLMFM